MFEDDLPKAPAQAGLPRNLEPLSVEELETYLGQLDQEKDRVRAEIERRGSAKTGADAVFKF